MVQYRFAKFVFKYKVCNWWNRSM